MAPQTTPDRLAWLLTVTGGQQTMRWISEDASVTVGGVRVGVAYGLEADDLTEGEAGRGAAVVAFEVPDDVDDVMSWLRALRLSALELALAPVFDGVARWEDRLVLRYGRAEDVEYDAREHAVSVALLGNELEDTSDLCPPEASVEKRTWPLSSDAARGRRYPFVYGEAGAYVFEDWTDNSGTTVITYDAHGWATGLDLLVISTSYTSGATPAMAVDIETETIEIAPSVTIPDPWPRYLLIADGWVDDDVSTVELWAGYGETGNGWITSTDGTIVRGYDGRDRPVTLLDISALNSSYRRGGKWWIGWSGGAPRTGALGQLVLEVLRRATCAVDWPAVRRAAAYLDRYKIGGFVSDSISATAWVKNRTERAGVIARWTTAGFGLVVTDPSWQQPAVARLVIGEDEAAGPLRLVPPQTDVVQVAWTGEGAAETAKRRVLSTVRRAQDLGPAAVGERSAEVSAPECWDASTAIALGELALRRVAGHAEVAVITPIWWLQYGDVVELTWDALEIDAEAWLVVQVTHTTDPVRTVVLRRYDAARYRSTPAIEVRS